MGFEWKEKPVCKFGRITLIILQHEKELSSAVSKLGMKIVFTALL
jgi:hypothetical protein